MLYRSPLVATDRRHGEAYERGQIEIDAKHRRLFVGSSDRGLYCLDARDGTPLWRFETVGDVQSAPLYDAETESLYFGSSDGALYKLDARNGELRYRFATNSEVAERPVLVKDRLYFVNANDTVIALDAATGKMLWNQHRTPVNGMQIAGHSGLLVWGSRVYVGFSDGMVVAFDATSGAERWQPVDLGAEAESNLGAIPQHFDVDTTPVPGFIDGSPVVYVASSEGGLFALDADTGTQVWQNPEVLGTSQLLLWDESARLRSAATGDSSKSHQPAGETLVAGVSSNSASAFRSRLLIAATGSSGLWGIDPSDGSVVWRSRLPDGGVAGPVPVAGALMVSASQLGIYLVSPLNGKVIDGLHLAEGVSALPAALGSHAFVLTNQGQLTAIHVATPKGDDAPIEGVKSRHW
ncbi:MAG: PQQ-binding-like beta-propeller repeat protein [Polyangiaceae bacterium]